jgi:hypothetical protein
VRRVDDLTSPYPVVLGVGSPPVPGAVTVLTSGTVTVLVSGTLTVSVGRVTVRVGPSIFTVEVLIVSVAPGEWELDSFRLAIAAIPTPKAATAMRPTTHNQTRERSLCSSAPQFGQDRALPATGAPQLGQ